MQSATDIHQDFNGSLYDDIEKEIINIFSNIVNEYDILPSSLKNTQWVTNEIKMRVGSFGEEKGFDVSSSLHNREWLLDMIWRKNTVEGNLEKIILSLESELSNRNWSEIKYDFEKLLITNSKYKVMTCMNAGNSDYPNNVNQLIRNFEKAIKANKDIDMNQRILILIWDDYFTGDVIHRLFINNEL